MGGLAAIGACVAGGEPARHGHAVVFASGADLQSMNPLVTLHPLARQVQKYVLLTTLARYDTALTPQPYLARSWTWSPGRRSLTFRLFTGLRWSDGHRTVARDVAWTLNTARDAATGYPRLDDLGSIAFVDDPNDSTVVVRFATPQQMFPDVLTDLAILPAHLLDSVPHERLRQAAWNERPVANGPFRFVQHEANRRWVFARNAAFPAELGGPPLLDRLVVVVVDEPTTKLAALVGREIDFAGIQPAHVAFVRRDSGLTVIDYPTLYPYGIVFNERLPGRAASRPIPTDPDSARRLLGGRQVSFELLTVGSGEAPLEQLLQAQLARAGFAVTIRQLELSAYLARVYGSRHEFEAAVLGIQGDPGLGYLSTLARVAGTNAPADPAAAQRMFRDSLPVAFLYYARGVQGMNRRVLGVRMDLRGELPTVAQWHVAP